jgi:hypothetical protein
MIPAADLPVLLEAREARGNDRVQRVERRMARLARPGSAPASWRPG